MQTVLSPLVKLSVFSFCVLVTASENGEAPSDAILITILHLVSIILTVVKYSSDFVLLFFSSVERSSECYPRGDTGKHFSGSTNHHHHTGHTTLLGKYILEVAAKHVRKRYQATTG